MKHHIFKLIAVLFILVSYKPAQAQSTIEDYWIGSGGTEILYDTERRFDTTARWYVDFGGSVFVQIEYLSAGRPIDSFSISAVDDDWNVISSIAYHTGSGGYLPSSTVTSYIPNGKALISYTMYQEYQGPFTGTYGLYFSVTTIPNPGLTYGYDAAGNRTSRTIVIAAPATLRSGAAEPAPVFEETVEYSDGIEKQDAEILIYPNPTRGMFAVEIRNLTEETSGEVQLYRSDGQLVEKRGIDKDNRIEFDISRESTGVYFMNIHIGEKVSTWKIIKQ